MKSVLWHNCPLSGQLEWRGRRRTHSEGPYHDECHQRALAGLLSLHAIDGSRPMPPLPNISCDLSDYKAIEPIVPSGFSFPASNFEDAVGRSDFAPPDANRVRRVTRGASPQVVESDRRTSP